MIKLKDLNLYFAQTLFCILYFFFFFCYKIHQPFNHVFVNLYRYSSGKKFENNWIKPTQEHGNLCNPSPTPVYIPKSVCSRTVALLYI